MSMRMARVAGACALAWALAGCSDFLTGDGLGVDDPNRPTDESVARDQLFVGMQVRGFVQLEGNLARTAGIWTQQFGGVGQQYLSLGNYEFSAGFFNGDFNNFYVTGGLVDQRKVIAGAEAAGEPTFAAIAKIHHALLFGMASSLWGDLPYSEAAMGIRTPRLDPQAVVYDSVQMHLDQAIADLASASPGRFPGNLDLVFGVATAADRAKWIQVAYTLKARYHMHWAAREPQRYALARDAAERGIASPANDFRTLHSSARGEENIWHQFQRQRSGYMLAGDFLVRLLQQRSDPRLAQYFAPVSGTTFAGASPGEGGSAFSNLSAVRIAAEFRQPVVTYVENQLILAETSYRLNDEVRALTHLNEARASAGLAPLSASGEALLREILTEAYIALFQNVEVYSLYRRTCWPEITPPPGKRVPGRLYYSENERNANPNVPSPTDPAFQRNANDPGVCTASVIGSA